jgi:hypothetical protein
MKIGTSKIGKRAGKIEKRKVKANYLFSTSARQYEEHLTCTLYIGMYNNTG